LAAEKESKLVARGKLDKRERKRPMQWVLDPALIMIVLVTIAGVGTIFFAGTMGIDECKAVVKEEKRKKIEVKVRRQQQKAMFKSAVPSESPQDTREPEQKVKAKGTEQFKSVFDTKNLTGESATPDPEPPKAKGTEQFKNVFDPENLKDSAGTGEDQ
jgi:hypothetical protein